MRIILTAILLLTSVSAFAAPPVEEGFSGSFDIGAFAISTNDALSVNDKNEDIDDLDDNPDSAGEVLGAILFDLKYRKNSHLFHIGTPLEGGEPQLLAGYTFLKGESSYDISMVINPLGEKWKDPYVLDRSKTDSVSAGLRLKAENIADSSFNIELKAISHDIDDDVIGERFSEMKRDGSTYTVKLEYGYDLGSNKELTPYIEYTREDRDGDAQSADGYAIGTKYSQPIGNGIIIPTISIATMEYDEENPVFGKTREDTSAKAFVMYIHKKPFGWENKHITVLAGTSKRFSNIDFYDATSYFGGVTFGFDF